MKKQTRCKAVKPDMRFGIFSFFAGVESSQRRSGGLLSWQMASQAAP